MRLLACTIIAVGTVGFLYHLREISVSHHRSDRCARTPRRSEKRLLIPSGDDRLLITKEARPPLRTNLGIPLVAEDRS